MKKVSIIVLGMLMAVFAYSQTVQKWTENFDGAVSFTATPSGSWISDVTYHVLDFSTINPKSYLGLVPSKPGDTTTLQTGIYDCRSYDYVLLRFSHICKVSPQDTVRIEYRTNMGSGMSAWNSLPAISYLGKASNFKTSGFNAESYPEWQANDSLLLPPLSQSWWKEEAFDLEVEAKYSRVQFRFVIIHGKQQGTQASYGWLIDNFELAAAMYPLYPPVVEFIAPLVKDTVYNTGPWEINAKVKTQTNSELLNPYLKYQSTLNGTIVATDSVLMTMTSGDTLWKVSIPEFIVGTKIVYSITGQDSAKNFTTLASQYEIIRSCKQGGENGSNNCVEDPYSAIVYSIDMPDTIQVSPTTVLLPIIASIKNVGQLDINSAIVWYSVNGSNPVSKTWSFNQAVPWDMNYQDTAGTYLPKVNSFDTIMVWVKMPNGQIDPLTNDDTITKVIYISGDIQAEFIPSVTDTVYTTGLHEIKAKIVSLTGVSLPPIRLYIASTYQSVTAYDTLDMFLDMSDTSWKITLPHYRFGTDVSYSIKLKDIWGNDIVLSDNFYIKRVGCTTADGIVGGVSVTYDFFYTGSVQTVNLSPGSYQIECWGADGGDGTAGTGLGGSVGGKGGYSRGTYILNNPSTLYIYVGGKGQSGNNSAGNIPDGEGGWNGGGWGGNGSSSANYKGGGGGGTDVRTTQNTTYDNRIIVAGGGGGAGGASNATYAGSGGNGGGLVGQDGLLGASQGITHNGKGGAQNQGGDPGTVYTVATAATAGAFGIGGNGGYNNNNSWPSGGGGGGWYGGGGGSIQGGSGGGGSGYIGGVTAGVSIDASQIAFVPNPDLSGNGYVRIISEAVPADPDTLNCLDHSVGLESIISPDSKTVTAGIATPVLVIVRNRGVKNLDSCYINWSLNGVIQPGTTVYHGQNILEDFTDTITIGYYIPIMRTRDTVTVWVSMPNGQVDAYTNDDILTVLPLGCPGINNSIRNIPGDFATIGTAISSMLECGITGKVVLEFEPNIYTGTLDLSALKDFLTSKDTLVIRSSGGTASDVTFKAASGAPALRINGIRNLYIEHITFDAASGTHGVEIIGQCDNVEINSCIINASTTSTSLANGCGVYYNGNSGSLSMGNIRLLNNTITDGHSGIYFNYLNPSSTAQATSTSAVRITGNTIENSYANGVYSNFYACYDSIAYNIINTRAISTTQYGIYLLNFNRVNDGIIGNKINMRGIALSYAIYPYQLNNSITGAGGNPALIANNEIRRFASSGTFYGLYHYASVASYINNSVYAGGEGTGTNYAFCIYTANSANPCTIMNNLFICAGKATGSQALYCPTPSHATPAYGTTMDYNDYYSTGTSLSNIGATLPLLRAATQQDIHSVNINPEFLNTTNNLELKNSLGLTVPRVASVSEDINRLSRLTITTMGAYELPPTKRDLMLLSFASGGNDVVNGQTVQVSVDAQNLGVPITTARFGWSVNGVNQTPSLWTPTSTLGSFAQQIIPIGSFVATGVDTFHVVVWIETINGQQDQENWNDTVSTVAFIAPLAEFVAPFVGDTISSLSFDVNVKIREGSGGAVNTPEMYIETLMDGSGSCYIHTYDTITLIQDDNKWVANIPKQYYGSRVIYETHISDAIGNNVILKDSARIMTKIGGSNRDVYAGNNLAIFNLVSPENKNDELCAAAFSPVEIELLNLGENNYDFTKDSITIGYEIINPREIIYKGNITINTEELLLGEGKTIELMSAIPIIGGSYTIKAWVTSAIDNFICDDTLKTVYVSSLISLPVDEDFSGNVLSSVFVSTSVTGTETWLPYSDSTSQIQPPSGNGMLCYAGSYGSMSVLATRQLDLNGAVDPKLEFWYYHDTSLSATDRSFTNVNVIADGVTTLIQTLFKKDIVHGWKQYTVDLKKYTTAQCVFIEFESMNKSELQLPQYIGRVTITSIPDLAVSSIIISPEFSVCSLTNKELKVGLTTTANQSIDFSNSGNSLTVQVGSQTPIIYPLTGVITGSTSDTVSVASGIDLTGVTDIKAWLTFPVDNYPSNDTAIVQININPSLAITVISLTGEINCFPIGTPVQQQIYLKNTGNVDLPGIEFLLRITGDNTMEFVKEIGSIDLQAGKDTLYTFVNTYIVPDEASYQIVVTAYLGCDSVKVHITNDTNECADIDNLILSPGDLGGLIDTTGSTKTLTVMIENKSETNSFTNIPVTALIEDKDRQVVETLTDTISAVNHQSTLPFSFTKKYTVPNDSIYYIKVYLSSVDVYLEDDTITITRNAIDTSTTDDPGIGIALIKEANVFTLSQNIPNPANNSTRIDYSVPEAGEVIFHVHSITGQLLYSQTIETKRGTNSIELNTTTFAAGVYFYSMEYKGQRLVKQLIIK